jgi:membrane fusion protein (multidrug efflux system)
MKSLVKLIALALFLGLVGFGTQKYVTANTATTGGAGAAPVPAPASSARPAGSSGGASASEKPSGAAAAAAPASSSTAPAPKPLVVRTITVARESVPFVVQATGTLRANESADITSESTGRIVSVEMPEGSEVKKGDLLFRIDSSEIAAEIKELNAQLAQARSDSERLTRLLSTQATSQIEVDRAKTEVDRLDAQLDLLKARLAKTEIRAPFDGRLGLRAISPGTWATPGLALTTLVDASTLKLDFKVPERHAKDVRPGMKLRFQIEAESDWREATIAVVDPTIDAATRSVIARATAPNPSQTLKPGAFTSIELPIEVRNSILVPAGSVVASARGNSVYIVADGGTAALRPITAGIRFPDRLQVVEGLKEGDQVITTNLLRMRQGSKLTIDTKSSAAPAAPAASETTPNAKVVKGS